MSHKDKSRNGKSAAPAPKPTSKGAKRSPPGIDKIATEIPAQGTNPSDKESTAAAELAEPAVSVTPADSKVGGYNGSEPAPSKPEPGAGKAPQPEQKVRIEPFRQVLGDHAPPAFSVLQGDDLVKWAIVRNREIDAEGAYLTSLYFELGGALDKLKQDPQYGAYGRWERCMKRWGIQRTRATKALAIYHEHETVEQCGQLPVDKAYQAAARKGRSRKNRHQQGENPQPTGAVFSPAKDIRLVCCPFSELDVGAASVHSIATDPPWGKDWLEEYLPRFAEFSARVLVEGGILAVWYGNTGLDDFIRVIAAERLTLQHLLICPFEQPGLLDGTRQFIQHYDLCLVFSKGGFALEKPVVDLLPVAVKEKDLHPWQRSRAQMDYLVRAFSRNGDMVCDPCVGSGTTAESCLALGRRFVGCDRDPACVEQWKKRFNAVNARLYDELHMDAVSGDGEEDQEPGCKPS